MKFAKVCKVLRFVFLPLTIFMLALVGVYAYIYQHPELHTTPVSDEEAMASLLYILAYAVIFLVADVIFFIVYARHKARIEWESIKEDARDKRVGIGKRRKLKIAFRVIGIILVASGLLFSYVHPLLGWLFVLGVPFIVLSFAIRSRKHAAESDTNRRYDGDRLIIDYPDREGDTFYAVKCMDVIQDAFNDGYLIFEDYKIIGNGRVQLTFKTGFTREQLQEQHDRRDKYYLSGGANAHEMPPYFSPKPIITFDRDVTYGERFETKTAIYTYDEVKVYKGDTLVRTEQRNKRLSHYRIETYEYRTEYYYFFYKNGDQFVTVPGKRQLIVEYKTKVLIDTREEK